MSRESTNNNDEMQRAIAVREQRQREYSKEGERPLWRNVSMIGALGWLVVMPLLVGTVAGRWLDHRFDTGIFFSGALIFLGVVVGCYLAWQRISRE